MNVKDLTEPLDETHEEATAILDEAEEGFLDIELAVAAWDIRPVPTKWRTGTRPRRPIPIEWPWPTQT